MRRVHRKCEGQHTPTHGYEKRGEWTVMSAGCTVPLRMVGSLREHVGAAGQGRRMGSHWHRARSVHVRSSTHLYFHAPLNIV